jgi:hypothetical protein
VERAYKTPSGITICHTGRQTGRLDNYMYVQFSWRAGKLFGQRFPGRADGMT